jgi:hypothetical protein
VRRPGGFTIAKLITTITLAFTGFIGAFPSNYTTSDIATLIELNNVTSNINSIHIALGCTGQSYNIATMSSSTGRLPTRIPEGGSDVDNKCIAKYNPEGVKAAIASKPVTKQKTSISSAVFRCYA